MRLFGALVAVLLLAGACKSTPAPVVAPPSGTHEIVFQMQELGGLLPPGGRLKMPRISIYGGGLLVAHAPSAEPPAVPRATQRRLTLAGVRKVAQAAADAGLSAGTDFGTPQITDAPVTVFTLVSDGKPQVTNVIAPNVAGAGDLTGAQVAARDRLRAFTKQLADLDSWLGKEIAAGSEPYTYTAMAVFAMPQEGSAATRDWPLGDLSAGTCVTVTGPELDKVRGAAEPTSSRDLWRAGDSTYFLVFRPLLPGETQCPLQAR
ncbi:MAG TPA: hypothetical protein DGT23_28020 [Micromonosporaceae bacterium]|nr:hypothetical protein [Micromonosporaceae bacterium]